MEGSKKSKETKLVGQDIIATAGLVAQRGNYACQEHVYQDGDDHGLELHALIPLNVWGPSKDASTDISGHRQLYAYIDLRVRPSRFRLGARYGVLVYPIPRIGNEEERGGKDWEGWPTTQIRRKSALVRWGAMQHVHPKPPRMGVS